MHRARPPDHLSAGVPAARPRTGRARRSRGGGQRQARAVAACLRRLPDRHSGTPRRSCCPARNANCQSCAGSRKGSTRIATGTRCSRAISTTSPTGSTGWGAPRVTSSPRRPVTGTPEARRAAPPRDGKGLRDRLRSLRRLRRIPAGHPTRRTPLRQPRKGPCTAHRTRLVPAATRHRPRRHREAGQPTGDPPARTPGLLYPRPQQLIRAPPRSLARCCSSREIRAALTEAPAHRS